MLCPFEPRAAGLASSSHGAGAFGLQYASVVLEPVDEEADGALVGFRTGEFEE